MTGPHSRRITATLLGGWVVLVLGFLFIPIAIILTYAFDTSPIQGWPIAGFTTHWFDDTWADEEIREAFLLSTEVALAATLLAVLLGSLAAFAVYRFAFFGKEVFSFLLILPIALPGIITGMALNS